MAPKINKTDMPFTVFSVEADTDYLLARMISFLGAAFHARAGYFAQQASEKYLKALSVQHDGTYAETHKLLDLVTICEPHYPFLHHKEVEADVKKLDMFDQVGRYGGAANFDPMSKGRAIAGAQFFPGPNLQIAGAWIWTRGHLHSLDRFVFNTRSRLDFRKAHYDDGLLSVLTDNHLSYLLSTWQGPIPLKEILTRDNT